MKWRRRRTSGVNALLDMISRYERRIWAIEARNASRATEYDYDRGRTGSPGWRDAPGFGRCMRCVTPWRFVRGHTTEYGDHGSGMFPLCEDCWQELGTPEARLPFYRVVWEQWCVDIRLNPPGSGVGVEPYETLWPTIEAAVLDEA